MHAAEREKAIMGLLEQRGFIAFRDLEKRVTASPATLRRDLERMAGAGLIDRVHGGASLPANRQSMERTPMHLAGVPFHENIRLNRAAKEVIGLAAASLCEPGSAVMIDGGSTTLQMCPHLDGLDLQVLTNSLHIVSALLAQRDTRLFIPGGAVFPEQDIVLAPGGEDLMPQFFAPKLFMGAASVGAQGVMQADPVLVAAERRFIERAEQLILLVDSSKFRGSSGSVVCGLDSVDIVVTDGGIEADDRKVLEAAGIELVIAGATA